MRLGSTRGSPCTGLTPGAQPPTLRLKGFSTPQPRAQPLLAGKAQLPGEPRSLVRCTGHAACKCTDAKGHAGCFSSPSFLLLLADVTPPALSPCFSGIHPQTPVYHHHFGFLHLFLICCPLQTRRELCERVVLLNKGSYTINKDNIL